MKKFFFILNGKFTVGNIFSIICSILFAIILRHLYFHFIGFLPLMGELEALDISYLSIVAVFKLIFTALLEYLLEDKFYMPLSEAITQKRLTTFMVNSDSQSSNPGASSKYLERKYAETDAKLQKDLEYNQARYDVGTKMWNVLDEQSEKLAKLRSIKSDKRVQFLQEDGGLQLDVPSNMTDTEANSLAKQVGALDRALLNKFSEYNNLSGKDVRLYESKSTDLFKERADLKRKEYEDLFENTATSKKK